MSVLCPDKFEPTIRITLYVCATPAFSDDGDRYRAASSPPAACMIGFCNTTPGRYSRHHASVLPIICNMPLSIAIKPAISPPGIHSLAYAPHDGQLCDFGFARTLSNTGEGVGATGTDRGPAGEDFYTDYVATR